MSKPTSNIVVLTEPLVRAGMKAGIGLKRKQAKILGESYPVGSGWIGRALGKEISGDDYDRFLGLREAKMKKRRKFKRKRSATKPTAQS